MSMPLSHISQRLLVMVFCTPEGPPTEAGPDMITWCRRLDVLMEKRKVCSSWVDEGCTMMGGGRVQKFVVLEKNQTSSGVGWAWVEYDVVVRVVTLANGRTIHSLRNFLRVAKSLVGWS